MSAGRPEPCTVLCGVFLLAALLIAISPAPAQEPAPAGGNQRPAEPFFDAVNVEIVNIDVWVSDKSGQPIDGLSRDDFEVFVDGQPTEITNFYAVSQGRPDVRETAPPAAPEQAQIGLRPEDLTVAPEHRLWLIVYVDNFNIDPTERNRILPALQSFFARALGPGDRAMVVSYTSSLKVRQPFTDRVSELMASLDGLRDEAGLAAVRRREQMDTLRRIDNSDSALAAMIAARQYAEDQMNNVDVTIDALQRLVDTLAGLPGRKALLHVSSGIPMLAGEEMFHAVGEKFGASEAYGEIPRHDTTRRFERLIHRATEQRVTVHTMDAGGLRGLEFGSAEYGGFTDQGLRSTLDSVVPENLQSPLRLMALETGGRAILNRNEILPALDEVTLDFRSFYSLGISSVDADSGRYHEIEVKLRERPKGARVRHRTGYRSKSLDTRIRESLRSALLYAHQENPLNLEVLWGRAQPHGDDGLYLLPIQLRVPLADIVLLPTTEGKHEARLELFVAAVGPDSQTSPIDDSPFGLRLADEHVEAARGESLLHTHRLLLAPGRQKVGVAVLDVFAGQSSVVTGLLQIGPRLEEAESGRGQ